jgi:D-galacturonate reductase
LAGDLVTIFTPDDTHFAIALACVEAGLHVLVTKPIVKTLADHRALADAAAKAGVLVMVEVHKRCEGGHRDGGTGVSASDPPNACASRGRYDPIYVDAKDRIGGLGNLSYMYAYMSQPKHQLDTFRAWAGKASDISYYLNSHHVDFTEWACLGASKPVKVSQGEGVRPLAPCSL